MIAATGPVNVTVAVPLPAIPALPPETVSVPCATDSVTVRLPAPASTSDMLSPVMALLVSSFDVKFPERTRATAKSVSEPL